MCFNQFFFKRPEGDLPSLMCFWFESLKQNKLEEVNEELAA